MLSHIVHLIIYLYVGAFVLGMIMAFLPGINPFKPKPRTREEYFANMDSQLCSWRENDLSNNDKRLCYGRKNDLSNTDNQLRFVSDGDFSLKPIISLEVYFYAFLIVESFINDLKRGYRVFPELSLGAVLWCRDETEDHRAFKSINSKRVDIGIVDKHGKLVLAVEYQGAGHYQGNAEGRDAVKRLALSKVGVEIVEIFPHDDPEKIKEKLSVALGLTGLGRSNLSALSSRCA